MHVGVAKLFKMPLLGVSQSKYKSVEYCCHRHRRASVHLQTVMLPCGNGANRETPDNKKLRDNQKSFSHFVVHKC